MTTANLLFTDSNGNLFTTDGATVTQLTNGSSSPAFAADPIYFGTSAAVVGSTVYIAMADATNATSAIWAYNGSSVTQITSSSDYVFNQQDSNNPSAPYPMASFNGNLVFSQATIASNTDGNNDTATLAIYNPTTQSISQPSAPNGGYDPHDFATIGSVLYFEATDSSTHSTAIYSYDGSTVTEIYNLHPTISFNIGAGPETEPGPGSVSGNLVAFNGNIYFGSGEQTVYELTGTGSLSNSASVVSGVTQPDGNPAVNLFVVGSHLFFQGISTGDYSIDTSNNVTLILGDSGASAFIPVNDNGTLYFTGFNFGAFHESIYTSNGGAATTVVDNKILSSPLTLGGTVYYNNGSTGLGTFNGTSLGTLAVPGDGGGTPLIVIPFAPTSWPTTGGGAPSLSVSINGSAQEGATLTAQVSGAAGGDTLSYQWQSGGTDIPNATNATYLVAEGDEGNAITVVVTDVTAGSTASGTTAGTVIDATPSISVSIAGTAQEGQTLSAQVTGAEGDDTLSYQWQSGGVNIANATSATYLVAEADEAKTITVVVTDTADNGGGTTTASATTAGTVIDAAPQILGVDLVLDRREGQLNSVSATVSDDDDTVTYAWVSNGVTLSTNSSYVNQETDEGQTIQIIVTDTADNGGGSTSEQVFQYTVIDLSPSISVSIGGTAQEGATLTAQVSGAESDDTLTYQWQSGGVNIANATGSTYQVVEADEGNTISVVVTDTIDNGIGVPAYDTTTATDSTEPVIDAAPSISVSISGTAQEGQTLTAQVTGAESDDVLIYQWQSGGVDIAGATNSTYVVQESDEGKQVQVVVTDVADNGGGSTTASDQSGVVIDITPALTAVTIASSANPGDILTAVGGTPNDSDATVTYQWQVNGVNVANATNATYQVHVADEGKQIQVVVTSHDTDGSGTSTTSNATSAVSSFILLPTIASFAPDTGVQGDFITAASNLTLAGTTLANATVEVFDAGAVIGQAAADGAGNWSLLVQGLANGLHNFAAETVFEGQASALTFPFDVTIDPNAPDHAPVAHASNFNVVQDQTVAVSTAANLSVSDADGDAITQYQFWETPGGANAGYFLINGAVQPVNQTFTVTAANLGTLLYEGGSFAGAGGADTLFVRAFDGEDYSAWMSFTATTTAHAPHAGVNQLPVVSVANLTATHGQSYTVAQLVSASDGDGDTITKYQFWDDGHQLDTTAGTVDPTAGYFLLNGQRQPEGQAIEVQAAALASLTFQSASGTNILWARAYDGFAWGAWKSFTVTAPIDPGPTAVVSNHTITKTGSIAGSALVSASDADGDTVATYQFWDNTADPSGYFVLNGVAQPVFSNITVSAAQLASFSFQGGAGPGGAGSSDDLWVRAADQYGVYGAWQEFHVNAVDRAPVVTGNNVNLGVGTTSVALSAMFQASDPDGDPITQYQLWDGLNIDPNSGYFDINGPVAAQNQIVSVSTADFANTTFVKGTESTTRTEWMRAYDGVLWSAWTSITVTESANAPPPANTPATVTVHDLTATTGQTFAASALFSASDSDGDTITHYQFWDSGGDVAPLGGIGHFVLNGETLGENQSIDVTSAQLGSLRFASGSDSVSFGGGSISALEWVRAFDGFQWSPWVSFHINEPVDSAPPTVNVANASLAENQVVAASSLFSASDHAGASIQNYEFYQNQSATGAHFDISGTPVLGYNHNIDVAAGQLSQVTFQGGAIPGTDTLWLRANDGVEWSAWQSFTATTHA